MATARRAGDSLAITMTNRGPAPLRFVVTVNPRTPGAKPSDTVGYDVPARDRTVFRAPTADGWYDVTVTADRLEHRFAGRIEPQ